jgi:hypothetical protein
MNKGENSLADEIEMEIDGDHEVGLVHCLLVCLEKNAEHTFQFQIETPL